MGILRLSLLLAALLILAVPAFARDNGADSLTQAVRDAYLGYDAGSVLEQCEYLHWTDQNCHTHFQQSFLLKDPMTEREQWMIGTFMVLEGKEMGVSPSVRRAIEYAERTGNLPVDGIELLNLYDSYSLTSEGLAEWQLADAREQLAMIRRAINPATGRVYETFTAREWAPFGIRIEKLTGDDSVRAFPLSGINSEGASFSEMRAYQGWQITVYGEEPGSVLIDKPIWREIKSKGPLRTGCGCRVKDSQQEKEEDEQEAA